MKKKTQPILTVFFISLLTLAAGAYAAEQGQQAKPDLNSINRTLPGGGLQDDFGGPVSAPGTFSGFAMNTGGGLTVPSAPAEITIHKEIEAMTRLSKHRKSQSKVQAK